MKNLSLQDVVNTIHTVPEHVLEEFERAVNTARLKFVKQETALVEKVKRGRRPKSVAPIPGAEQSKASLQAFDNAAPRSGKHKITDDAGGEVKAS